MRYALFMIIFFLAAVNISLHVYSCITYMPFIFFPLFLVASTDLIAFISVQNWINATNLVDFGVFNEEKNFFNTTHRT